MKKIINAKLIDNTNIEILIKDKKIVKIADKIDEKAEIIDANNNYVISGLVNCYFDGNLNDVYKLLQQGITSVFDFSFDDGVTQQLLKLGIKTFKAIGDYNGEILLDKDKLKAEIDRFKTMGVSDVILYAVNPNLSEESNYSELINCASETGCMLATSVSEHLEDVGEIDNQFSLSPVGLLESYGFLDHKHMLIDCVYADKEDVNLLINYDTTICTCPTKNLKSASGIAPVYSFVKNGLNVVVGGTTSNHFKELSLIKDLQSGTLNESGLITEQDVLKMSSENAQILYSQIGLLKENEYADIVIVDDNNLLNLTPINVKMVFVDGDIKYRI